MIANLKSPPGRNPDKDVVSLSNWYNELSEADKKSINEIIRRSVRAAIFNLFCVLDGVLQIENSFDRGVLKLYYQKGEKQVLLNNHDEDYLHDLL